MNFDITRPPTVQDLFNMNKLEFRHRRFMLLLCIAGFIATLAFSVVIRMVYYADPQHFQYLLIGSAFFESFTAGLVLSTPYYYYWYHKPLPSDSLTPAKCDFLYSILNNNSCVYVQMINTQSRPISYFDYDLIMAWHKAEQERKSQNIDSCVKLHSI